MKKIRIFILIIVISQNIGAQNWNVFNKDYRYNYKFNNSTLVSNVLYC